MSRIFVISGAGLSAESGVATFRDTGGLWSQFDLNRVCNIRTWRRHRDEVYDFYGRCKAAVREAKPNDAHRRLAAWQQEWGAERVVLLTQNVDDLLERAGATSVTHLHGDLESLSCTACGHQWTMEGEEYDAAAPCPQCLQVEPVKPGVVFFGEMAPAYGKLYGLHESAQDRDFIVVVGSAMEVVTVDMVVPHWRAGDPRTIQINPTPAYPQFFGKVHACAASKGLAEVEAYLRPAMGS